MSRLEKKCLMASGGMHVFLMLVVLFGAAFLSAPPKETRRMMNVIPTRLIDQALSGGGGNPKLARTEEQIKGDTMTPAQATAPQPPPPKVERRPDPVPTPPTPTPPKQTPKDPPKDPVTPKAELKPVPPKVEEPKATFNLNDLKPIPIPKKTQDSEKEKQAKQKAQEEAEAKAAAAEARAAAKERARKIAALTGLRNELSSRESNLKLGFKGGTQIDVGGPGGEAFADYKMFVQMAYENAWVITPELTDRDFIAEIKVTIARSGRVVVSRISKPSGSSTMDRTVQRAMDRVRSEGLPPFPSGATDAERTFTIEFNLKAKNRIG